MFFVPRSDEHRHLLPSVKALVDGGVPLLEGDVELWMAAVTAMDLTGKIAIITMQQV